MIGDPIAYRTLQARQATAIHGWAVHMYDETLWRELSTELRTVKPKWIMVDPAHGQYLDRRAPDLKEFIEANYQTLSTCSADPAAPVWYHAYPELHSTPRANPTVGHLAND